MRSNGDGEKWKCLNRTAIVCTIVSSVNGQLEMCPVDKQRDKQVMVRLYAKCTVVDGGHIVDGGHR